MNETVRSLDELPAVMNARDVMQVLNLSKGKVYEILNGNGLPVLRFGKRLLVTKADFLDYLEQNKSTTPPIKRRPIIYERVL